MRDSGRCNARTGAKYIPHQRVAAAPHPAEKCGFPGVWNAIALTGTRPRPPLWVYFQDFGGVRAGNFRFASGGNFGLGAFARLYVGSRRDTVRFSPTSRELRWTMPAAKKTSRCKGSEKRDIVITAYGDGRQSAYDNLVNRITADANPDLCTEDGCDTEGFDCLPHVSFDRDDIEFESYRTKKGKVKWSCTLDGTVTYKCKCAPAT